MLRRGSWRLHAVLARTMQCLKKSGKPLETPPYKQVYYPYETQPTQFELDRERRRFAQVKRGDKVWDVKDLPENMFTYGKEGMSIPISIFKEQPDPVIGPEHTYPLIYENKIAMKTRTSHELVRASAEGKLDSPLCEDILQNRVSHTITATRMKLKNLSRFERHRYLREKKEAASRGKGAAVQQKSTAAAQGKATTIRDTSGRK